MAQEMHQTHNQAPVEHHGPTVQQYIRIFVVLFIATAIEVLVAEFLEGVAPTWMVVGILLALMTLKGLLVVMFYMHLRFDSTWFRFLFTSGMIIAVFCVVALMLLFSYKFHQGTGLPPF